MALGDRWQPENGTHGTALGDGWQPAMEWYLGTALGDGHVGTACLDGKEIKNGTIERHGLCHVADWLRNMEQD